MEFEEKFTLHFATINTDKVFQMEKLKGYLHYTLLLLILRFQLLIKSIRHNLHYTLLLLIQYTVSYDF